MLAHTHTFPSRTNTLLGTCRSGEGLWKVSHKDWLKCRILEIFFLSDKAPSLVCQNGLLYTLHPSDAVSVTNFAKVCVPLSSGFKSPSSIPLFTYESLYLWSLVTSQAFVIAWSQILSCGH